MGPQRLLGESAGRYCREGGDECGAQSPAIVCRQQVKRRAVRTLKHCGELKMERGDAPTEFTQRLLFRPSPLAHRHSAHPLAAPRHAAKPIEELVDVDECVAVVVDFLLDECERGR